MEVAAFYAWSGAAITRDTLVRAAAASGSSFLLELPSPSLAAATAVAVAVATVIDYSSGVTAIEYAATIAVTTDKGAVTA